MGDALEFDRSADYYFRPWKIYTNESKKVKKCIGASKKWATKSAEHLDFLKRIFTSVQCKPQLLENPPMLLWSTTYLIALRDCETFATTQDVDKNKLSLLIPDPQDWARILELACWVWSERFLNSGYELEMGCNMMIDLLDVSVYTAQSGMRGFGCAHASCHISACTIGMFHNLLCSEYWLSNSCCVYNRICFAAKMMRRSTACLCFLDMITLCWDYLDYWVFVIV